MARSSDIGWAGSGIWARGEGLKRYKKVNLGRKRVETEDEGKSSVVTIEHEVNTIDYLAVTTLDL